MKKTFLFILVILKAGGVWAADVKEPSLLGLQLGKSLAECGVSECAKKTIGSMVRYTHDDTTLCWEGTYYPPSVSLSTKGYFNLARFATVILDRAASNPATGKIILASLNFYPDNAGVLIDMLKEKFGKPVFEETSIVQNKMGAKFERVKTIWDFSNARIELDSRYNIDEGLIMLKPGSYKEEIKKTLEEIKSDKEKL